MGKMQKTKPSFFKVILHDSIEKLRIPPAFVQNFNEINPRKRLFLKVSTRYWAVRLKRFENELCFGKGWKSFVKDNCIEQGDFLVLKLLTGSLINVTIYDKTCCEKKKFGGKKIVEKHETLQKKSVKPDANAPLVDCGAKQRKLEGGLDDANGRACIYFTKIFRHGKTQKIPRKLAKKIGDELKNVVFVKVPSGDYCKVNLQNVHDKVSLGKGWESFISKHSITDGHLLIFKYNGNSCFDVLNLDLGISQENYGVAESSTGEPNTDGISQTANEERDDDEVSLVFTRVDRCETRTDSVKELVNECEEVESINTSPEDTNNHIKRNKHKAISARKSSNRLFLQNSVCKPKKPASAYMVFMEDFRITYKILYPNNRLVTEVAKAGGEKWKSMSDVDKAPHIAEAEKRRREYYKNLKCYFKNLTTEKSDDDENSCDSRFDLQNDQKSAREDEGNQNESVRNEEDSNEETEEVSDEEVSEEAYNGEGDTEVISEEEEENTDDDDEHEDSKEVSDEEDDDSEDKEEESNDECDEEASLEDDNDLEFVVIESDDDAFQD